MAFDKYLKMILDRAAHEATADGATTVEAEHLLLAMAEQSETDVGRFLAGLGLGHVALRTALDRESEQALNSVGVSLDAAAQRRKPDSSSLAGQLGNSVRHALERGLDGLHGAPRPGHLLLGVLQAEVGRVPRALALAGIDRAALIGQVRHALLG